MPDKQSGARSPSKTYRLSVEERLGRATGAPGPPIRPAMVGGAPGPHAKAAQ